MASYGKYGLKIRAYPKRQLNLKLPTDDLTTDLFSFTSSNRPLFFQLLKGFEQVSCNQTIQNKGVPEPRPNYIKEKSSQVIDYAIFPNGL